MSKLQAPVGGKQETIIEKYGKRIFDQEYTLPNGDKTDFLLFEASGFPVIIFPLTEDDEVIVTNQFRYGANEFVTELPGGNPKGNQSPEQVLKDELLSETGYVPEEIICLNEGNMLWFDPASLRVPFGAYMALGCERIYDPRPDETEILEVVSIPLNNWIKKIRDGEISDSKTIAVTMLALFKLGRI